MTSNCLKHSQEIGYIWSRGTLLFIKIGICLLVSTFGVFWVPEGTCKQLDRINRTFLWSNDITKRKLHSVGWKKITNSKRKGGLGIRPSREVNVSLLSKAGWRTLQEEESIWGDIFRKKYLKGRDILDYEPKAGDSPFWKGIVRSTKQVGRCIRWRIGDGKKTLFWFDLWLADTLLCDLVDDVIDPRDYWLTVADMRREDGSWNFDNCFTPICEDIQRLIRNFILPRNSLLEDRRIWTRNSTGTFSCKSSFDFLISLKNNNEDITKKRNWIWKIRGPNKIRFFIWLSHHNCLITNEFRFLRKIADSSACTRCGDPVESIVHALRDCPKARAVWEFVLNPTQLYSFLAVPSDVWIFKNFNTSRFDSAMLDDAPWSAIFLTTLWNIWRARNEEIFNNKILSVQEICFNIRSLTQDLLPLYSTRQNRAKGPKLPVKWALPAVNSYKLNTDGSVLTSSNSASVGGLIRDENGAWVVGFTTFLGNTSITVAELIAIRDGLYLAWERRLPSIEVETDSLVVYNLIRKETREHPLEALLNECRNLLRKPWNASITHNRRDMNRCADILAKKGHHLSNQSCIWEEPPTEIVPILLEEGNMCMA